jgi:hypothetical protein
LSIASNIQWYALIPHKAYSFKTTLFLGPFDDVITKFYCIYIFSSYLTGKTNRLMLFRERVAVYCENHTEHTDTLCRQNAEFYCVKAGGHVITIEL